MGKPTEELMFIMVTHAVYLTVDLEGLGHGSGSCYAKCCQMWITSRGFPHTLSTDLPWSRVHLDWKDETAKIAFFVVRYTQTI